MKDAKDLIPWQVTDISLRPYEGYWSFNPSIHFDGQLWRCVLRCCDYAMPGGVTIRSKNARSTGQQTKNAMVVLDPTSWKAVQVFKMHEKDDFPRVSTPHVGYEDMRIFSTDRGGLQGIAASLHLRRDHQRQADTPQHQPPEQVLLSFDGEYNVVSARPIRGDGWSGSPQKNWVPFDHCAEPRFLYSIDKGSLFDDRGALHGDAARVTPSVNGRVAPSEVSGAQQPAPDDLVAAFSSAQEEEAMVRAQQEREARERQEREARERQAREARHKEKERTRIRGGDVRIVRGGRLTVDASTSRPSARPSARPGTRVASRGSDSTRMMGTGRALPPKYNGLRGGTQLVRIGDDAWLGIGHEMKFVNGKKYYWHIWYVVDSTGRLKATSEPMKLAPNGIEFAAGMAIDGDRVVVSFGVDDMESKIGETQLSAVLATLRQIAR